jgi:hypothetical protein
VLKCNELLKKNSMTTLEMLNKAENDGKNYVYQDEHTAIVYSKKKGLEGFTGEGWFYSNIHMPLSTIDKFLNLDGWKEVIKVSDTEKAILSSLKCKWITRDKGGDVFCYLGKPSKYENNHWYSASMSFYLGAFNHLFKMVQWEDEEPTLIADLLKE